MIGALGALSSTLYIRLCVQASNAQCDESRGASRGLTGLGGGREVCGGVKRCGVAARLVDGTGGRAAAAGVSALHCRVEQPWVGPGPLPPPACACRLLGRNRCACRHAQVHCSRAVAADGLHHCPLPSPPLPSPSPRTHQYKISSRPLFSPPAQPAYLSLCSIRPSSRTCRPPSPRRELATLHHPAFAAALYCKALCRRAAGAALHQRRQRCTAPVASPPRRPTQRPLRAALPVPLPACHPALPKLPSPAGTSAGIWGPSWAWCGLNHPFTRGSAERTPAAAARSTCSPLLSAQG